MMKIQNLELKGEKVFLRYISIKDREEFIALNKANVEFFKGFIHPLTETEEFNKFIENSRLETNECFVICNNTDNKIVGSINLSQIFRKSFQNAYLGYWLGVKHTGNGFMSEAVHLILKHAFENLKLHRLEANVQPNNLASIKVLQRCGFRKEGFSRKYLKIDNVWRDHERWAIIFEDWEAK